MAQRAMAALTALPEAPVAVVVTHGGTAGRWLEALLGLGPDHRRVFGPLGNCSWSELVFQAPGWRVIRHNGWVPGPVEGSGSRPDPAGASAASAPRAGASPEEAAPAGGTDADAVL